MRGQTDGQRQQDKKPHHLLLYLIDLISGGHNSGQKQKQKTQKKQENKKVKSSELLSNRKTPQSMRLAQRMGVGAGWTAGTCVPLHWLQRYTSFITLSNSCCLNLTSPFTWFTKKSSGHSQVFCFFHGLACITGSKGDGHMEKSPSSVHRGLRVRRVRSCSTAGRNKDAFNQVKEKSQRSCRGHTGVSVEPASSICDFSWNNTLFRWLFWH